MSVRAGKNKCGGDSIEFFLRRPRKGGKNGPCRGFTREKSADLTEEERRGEK